MNSVFIIAEAGVNHNGSIDIAKKLIDVAVEAKVDAIKFQSFKAENIVTKDAGRADYQIENEGGEHTQFHMLKNLELSEEEHIILKKYCSDKGIIFMSSPFDLDSIDMLERLNLESYKIPSSEIENVPYLKKIGSLKKKIILSTGMSNLEDVEFAIKILKSQGSNNITLLHCTSSYPTLYNEVNLKAMITLKEKFNVDVGYSDHTMGIEVAIAAVALGASVIEKHFTLDRNMSGPDHIASLEPNELNLLVRQIRNIEKSLGSEYKGVTISEKNVKIAARKSLIALKDINEGEIFTEENLCVKRPGIGVSPKRWDEFIGEKSKRNYKKDELIEGEANL